MRFLYKIATFSYHLVLEGISPVNEKAKKWVQGRVGLRERLLDIEVTEPLIWFHCASLGEFEQGLPVMEAFKKRHPNWLLLVTFYSPSGYEARKDFPLADYVMYLPKETKVNVNLFLETFQPRIAVFVKYEFWYDYMAGLNKRNIPLIFVSSTFRESQIFFQPFGGWFLKQLKTIKMFFVQDKGSQELLNSKGIQQVEVSGDTRFDRVLSTVLNSEDISLICEFKEDAKVLIFGSSWAKETEFAIKIINNLPVNWKVILAPHEIEYDNIERFENLIVVNSVRFTEATSISVVDAKVLILDTIGHLAKTYKYADVAFVGGGFIDGIHNILEPLSFGAPVFFGPNHNHFWEAEDAIINGVGFEVRSYQDFERIFLQIANDFEKLKLLSRKSEEFVEERAGATEMVSQFLNKIGQIISCQI